MKFSKFLASSAVAISLVSAPVIAQAATATRASSSVDGEELGGGFLLPLLAAIAVGLAIWAITSNGDEVLPTSP
ncbi:MAG: hypothetical protein ABIT16_09420 [Croceibacterium sp.]